MASWDQDIHRIQEIQQLLESRQQYFGDHMKKILSKIDVGGTNIGILAGLQPTDGSMPEPSLGHSVEARFGSSEGNLDLKINSDNICEGLDNDGYAFSDDEANVSSEGHEGDCSDDASSGLSSEEIDEKQSLMNRNRKKSRARVLRKWVHKNIDQVSSSESKISNANKLVTHDTTRRNASLSFRQKSVSFEKCVSLEQQFGTEEMFQQPRRRAKIKQTDPFDLLKRRSSLLRVEVASRLKDDSASRSVLNSVTKGSLVYAREKLKNAEKLLEAAVRTEKFDPIKNSSRKSANKIPPPNSPNKGELSTKPQSRLSIRQAEEALKSDMNLREAFALIKINPDPILYLATPEKMKCTKVHRYSSSADFSKSLGERKPGPTEDDLDPIASESFKRLTQLSLQHKQLQKTLIPTSVSVSQTKSGKKSLKSLNASTSLDSTRRKSSTSSQHKVSFRKRSKDLRNGSPKLAFSGLEATLRAEKRAALISEQTGDGPTPNRSVEHALYKLTGTVL